MVDKMRGQLARIVHQFQPNHTNARGNHIPVTSTAEVRTRGLGFPAIRETLAATKLKSFPLGKAVPGACWERVIRRHADDRLHARQSAPLGSGRKRGEQKQAVGRSRGGRNTKIHALADAKGRLIAILLTGGEARDCPIAERLIRRVKPSKRMLGDKAYDSAELRDKLDERGTKPVIPNRCNRKQPFCFSKRLYKLRWRIESAFDTLKDFRRIATRYSASVMSLVSSPSGFYDRIGLA
jgi:transposase